MSRDLSAALKEQLFTPFRDEDLRFLLTVDHDSFSSPFRFVSGDPNELEELVSQGETFTTFPFEATLLNDGERADPRAKLRIQNVDDRIGSTLLDLPDEAVTITLQLVMRDTPDVIEYEAANMELVDVAVDAMTVTGTIVLRGQATEPCPGRVLTSRISPVFFR